MRTLLLLAIAVPLAAQAPVRLDRADASFPEPFSNPIGLRELSDGRFYGTAPLRFGPGGGGTIPDSVPVVRWSPTGSTDTLCQAPSNARGNVTIRVGAGGAASVGGRRHARYRR